MCSAGYRSPPELHNDDRLRLSPISRSIHWLPPRACWACRYVPTLEGRFAIYLVVDIPQHGFSVLYMNTFFQQTGCSKCHSYYRPKDSTGYNVLQRRTYISSPEMSRTTAGCKAFNFLSTYSFLALSTRVFFIGTLSHAARNSLACNM